VKVTGIEWDAANRRHFAERHRCRRQEVEDVLTSRCHPSRVVEQRRRRGDEQRLLIYGRTCRGRYLVIVAAPRPDGILRPITGWPFSDRDLEWYLRWQRSLRR
jgi:uncharacterized DUF497 family protein